MACLEYKTVIFELRTLDEPIHFVKPPGFIFHSVLGRQLRRLCCFLRRDSCDSCPVRFTCPYGKLFVTYLHKDNAVLKGRDKGSHPWLLASDAEMGQDRHTLRISLTMLGEAIEFFPYFYFSLREAGRYGLFRERIKYTIESATSDTKELLLAGGDLDVHSGQRRFLLEPGLENESHSLEFDVVTPLRLKKARQLVHSIDLEAFVLALHRRASILFSLYGSGADEIPGVKRQLDGLTLERNGARWKDLVYYSARQKQEIMLGGISGSFSIRGTAPQFVWQLFQFGELFHVGKNAGFGLGKYGIQQKEVPIES